MSPKTRREDVGEVIWNGAMEKAGQCPTLLDLGRGPSLHSLYGPDSLTLIRTAPTRGLALRTLGE